MGAPLTIRKPGPRCTRDEGSGSPGSFFLEGGERLRGGVAPKEPGGPGTGRAWLWGGATLPRTPYGPCRRSGCTAAAEPLDCSPSYRAPGRQEMVFGAAAPTSAQSQQGNGNGEQNRQGGWSWLIPAWAPHCHCFDLLVCGVCPVNTRPSTGWGSSRWAPISSELPEVSRLVYQVWGSYSCSSWNPKMTWWEFWAQVKDRDEPQPHLILVSCLWC